MGIYHFKSNPVPVVLHVVRLVIMMITRGRGRQPYLELQLTTMPPSGDFRSADAPNHTRLVGGV